MHLRTPFILLACLLFSQLHAENSRRPNIVVLIADDWGFSDVGAYGGEISTPTLNGLARQGQKFSNFHVSASCSPTRAMLLTGVDNHRNGVGNMRETIPQEHLGKSGYLTVLNQNVVTVSSLLKDGGYHTYAVGKWHVGQEAHNLPNQRGFERSLVQGDSGSDNWETSKRYLDLTEKVNWYEDGKEAVMPSEYYSSEYFVDKAIEYINSGVGDRKPFFAYVAFQANHIPIQAPREFIQRYQGRYKEGWEALRLAPEERDRTGHGSPRFANGQDEHHARLEQIEPKRERLPVTPNGGLRGHGGGDGSSHRSTGESFEKSGAIRQHCLCFPI